MNILEDQEAILEATNSEQFVADANKSWASDKIVKLHRLNKRIANRPENGEFYDHFGHRLKVGDFCIKFEGGNGSSLQSYPCYVTKFTPKMTKVLKCLWGNRVSETCVDSNNLVCISVEEIDRMIVQRETAQKNNSNH